MKSIQKWLPFFIIEENGIIKINNNKLIKILKINPINYELKNIKEKEILLNNYKKIFKSLNLNIQILIQSKKQNIDENIKDIKNNKYENKILKEYSETYINYLNKLTVNEKTNYKIFYLILSEENIEQINNKIKILKKELENCGNHVKEINAKEEIINIIKNIINKEEVNSID